ncbi:hypothetical protein NDU88_009275 [Pleurodeles waltl]|uniref:Uncharacterized protein n=1 Tax=Pleurodeles waltl TaxID=8319 RepID=A0AAV7RY08_PLEWA|nr:hypothetical protein NDU88_009275 [Pleurodeles waltl]
MRLHRRRSLWVQKIPEQRVQDTECARPCDSAQEEVLLSGHGRGEGVSVKQESRKEQRRRNEVKGNKYTVQNAKCELKTRQLKEEQKDETEIKVTVKREAVDLGMERAHVKH